nr:MAG: DNA pilot protein [Microvirus sp.]
MDPIIGGALISGGLGIGGGLLGGYLSGKSNEKAADQNAAIQRELAKNGLSWRVEDARKSGINPLAALGASLPSGNPVAVGTDYGDLGLGAAGQEISRAMQAGMTKEQREMHELNKRLLTVQIEGQEIENRNKKTGTPPPLKINPSPSLPLSSAEFPFKETKNKGYEIEVNKRPAAEAPGIEAGPVPMYQKYVDDEGNVRIMPSSQMGDLVESYTPLWITELTRNARLWGRSMWALMSDDQRIKFGNYLMKIRPKHGNPKYEYRWNLRQQRWEPKRKLKHGTSIFTDVNF